MIVPDNVLFILVLIFPVIGIIIFINDLIISIKLKNISGIISEFMFLLIIITLTVIYINILLNNDYEIKSKSFWTILWMVIVLLMYTRMINTLLNFVKKKFQKYPIPCILLIAVAAGIIFILIIPAGRLIWKEWFMY